MADVLKVQPKARIRITRDDAVLYDQDFFPSEVAFTESAGARVVLATNSGWQQFNMEGVDTGEYFMLESNRPIQVALNATSLYFPVGSGTGGGAMMLAGSSITGIYLNNESTTNVATVQVVVTD